MYVNRDRKAEIDWSDPEARREQLKVLVDDTEAVLDLAAEEADDAEVQGIGWLLTKILGDDVEADEERDPQIGQGTASDRAHGARISNQAELVVDIRNVVASVRSLLLTLCNAFRCIVLAFVGNDLFLLMLVN